METYNAAFGVKGAKPKVFKSSGEQTYEPCVGDMTSNGLWFAPECFSCLRTDKYQHIGNKACRHPWIEERLNYTGQYVMFGSNIYHRGYWNNLRGAVTVTAQHFCIPSTCQDIGISTRNTNARHPITGMKLRIAKDDFISGAIPKEDIQALTEVLVDNDGWSEMLGYKEYRPAPTRFQGVPIDYDSNRQIDQVHFPKLPLIKNLVRIFEAKFPEITVAQVWLIRKSSTESGFQAWHQDKVGLQTKTIVVNLGSAAGDPLVSYNPEFGKDSNCIDLDNFGESEKLFYNFRMEGGKLKQFMSYEQRLANMEVKNYGAESESDPSDNEAYNNDKDKERARIVGPLITVHDTDSEPENYEVEEEDNTDVSIRSKVRDEAIEKRQTRQAKQAEKHMKVAGKEAVKNGVGIGAVVSLYVDYRTHCHASGLLGIVFAFKENTGSVRVCCHHGIISHDGTKKPYWVPVNKYTVIAKPEDNANIPHELKLVRQVVLDGNYNAKGVVISFNKYVNIEQDPSTPSGLAKKKGCTCRKGCTKSCGCAKAGATCHSGCSCGGNCGNQ